MSYFDYNIVGNKGQSSYERWLKFIFFVLMIIDILLAIFIGVRLSFGKNFKSHPYGLWSMMFFAKALSLQGLCYTWSLQKAAQNILRHLIFQSEDNSFRIIQLTAYLLQ